MASREKHQKGQTKSRIRRRWVACFALAIVQTIVGLGLLAVGAADIVVTLDEKCKDRTGASFLQASGVVCLVSGSFALAAYLPRRVRAHGQPNRVLVAVHVLLSFLVAIVSFNVVTCLATYTGDKSTALFAVILSKVVLTYTCHVLGGICAGVAVPDLCRGGTIVSTVDTLQRDYAATTKQADYYINSADGRLRFQQCHGTSAAAAAAGPVQLPEARSHVQEAPGTGEKLTVVTLPEADVIYAVPEHSYVVRRPEGSYAAPPGNSRLAPFFPTYTRVAVE
ncbi:hypothetical protein HPB47_008208 [Ixodes persulcatus]|uniref:Uncharacterized protein n=1 Tax=Ixodes persulcatus TaxID=34615 RepID=A0AC60P5E2_IXOPE|nr:hypothetical protein HPB47_008208 [Ixodes persulcatus]